MKAWFPGSCDKERSDIKMSACDRPSSTLEEHGIPLDTLFTEQVLSGLWVDSQRDGGNGAEWATMRGHWLGEGVEKRREGGEKETGGRFTFTRRRFKGFLLGPICVSKNVFGTLCPK